MFPKTQMRTDEGGGQSESKERDGGSRKPDWGGGDKLRRKR